jgi:hypothetical protein
LLLIERTPLGLHTLIGVVRALESAFDTPLDTLLEQIFQQARHLDSYQFSYDVGSLLADHAPVLALRL